MSDESRPAPATTPAAPAAPPARRGLSRGALFGIIGGGVALLLVIVVVVAVTAVGIASSVRTQAANDPRGVAKAYFAALAAGKASAARAHLTADHRSGPLLTDAVLAASKAIAPIGHVTVGKAGGSGYFPTVPVTYSLGAKRVTTTLRLYQNEDRSYSITGGVAHLDPGYLAGLDLTVDGRKVQMPEAGLDVFPGAYRVAVTTPSFEVDGDGVVELTGPDDSTSEDALKPKLTDAGLATYRRLVSAAVRSCLKQTTLRAGCGLTLRSPLSDGSRIEEGTVQRSTTPEVQAKLAHLVPESDRDTPTLVSGEIDETVDVKVDGSTASGQRGRFEILFGPLLGSAYVDFSQAHPAVSWR